MMFDTNRLRVRDIIKVLHADRYCTPTPARVFLPFETMDLSDVRVVIVGQSPYNDGVNATGIAFAIPRSSKVTATLSVINAEVCRSYGRCIGDYTLSHWVSQGVLLLNSILSTTIRRHTSDTDHTLVWHMFMEYLINYISTHGDNVVFMLWGSDAHKYSGCIRERKHVIESSFPSSRYTDSKHGPFIGSNVFSKCDKLLGYNIEWCA